MPIDIYLISNLAIVAFNLLALIISLLYCYRKESPRYLKVFPLYLFISLLIEIIVNSYISRFFHFQILTNGQRHFKTVFYNLFTLFELLVFAWFLSQVIHAPFIKRVLIALLTMFGIFFIIYSIKTNISKKSNIIAIILESVILLLPCLVYYGELITRHHRIELLKEPSFWLVTGIFFYLATILPYYSTGEYLLDHGLKAIAQSLTWINNFAIVVAYLLFVKGFTCRIKKL